MHSTPETSSYLTRSVLELCNGRESRHEPWRADSLRSMLEDAAPLLPDQGAFYQAFSEGARDLVESAVEDQILRRFCRQNLLAEGRILVDDRTYRDHLAHVCQVYLCGWLIVNRCEWLRCPPESWRPYGWHGDAKEIFECLNRAWLFTALLHDTAYSIEKAGQAGAHEDVVLALFRDLYSPATPGRVERRSLPDAARPIWEARCEWLSSAGSDPAADLRSQPVQEALQTVQQRADHGLLSGVAIWREAERCRQDDLARILRPAAVAMATHNFRHCVAVGSKPQDLPNAWLRLDLGQEPLGVLLVLCDELQMWGRERADPLVSKELAPSAHRFAATELT